MQGTPSLHAFVQQVSALLDQNEGEGSLQRGGICSEGRIFMKCDSKHLIFQLCEESISWQTRSQKCVQFVEGSSRARWRLHRGPPISWAIKTRRRARKRLALAASVCPRLELLWNSQGRTPPRRSRPGQTPNRFFMAVDAWFGKEKIMAKSKQKLTSLF